MQQFQPSVVQITITTAKRVGGLDSGRIINSRGYIMTNYHVVEGATGIQVEHYDSMQLPTQLTGVEPTDDLAVVQITPHLIWLLRRLLLNLQVGQTVVAIGNPVGRTQTVIGLSSDALGRNAQKERRVATSSTPCRWMLLSIPEIAVERSVDLQGELIGVPTLAIINPQFNSPASGVGFAIPSSRVEFIMPQLIQSGRVTDNGLGDLGVEVTTVTARLASRINSPSIKAS